MESLPPMLHWLTHQLERHRFGVPVILPTREQQPPFAYSVGLSLHGLPELIVVGLAEPGGALIQRLGRAAFDGAVDLRAGAVLAAAAGFGSPCRLDPVRAEWVDRYPLMLQSLAVDHVEVLQVVVPDLGGRWPEDPLSDPGMALLQGLLARPQPFRLPVRRAAEADRYHRRTAAGTSVLIPVIEGADRWNGQHELVHARHAADGGLELTQPPCLADWVPAGARVALGPPPEGVDVSSAGCAGAVAQVVDDAGMHSLAFQHRVSRHRDRSRVEAAFDQLASRPPPGRAVLSTTTSSWHVCTTDPHAVRARLRPLIRDGLLVEQPLLSSVEDLIGPCNHPRCHEHRR